MELWTGCVAGALAEPDYRNKLETAGFVDVGFQPTRTYTKDDVAEMTRDPCCGSPDSLFEGLDGAVMSAFIRARKPVAG